MLCHYCMSPVVFSCDDHRSVDPPEQQVAQCFHHSDTELTAQPGGTARTTPRLKNPTRTENTATPPLTVTVTDNSRENNDRNITGTEQECQSDSNYEITSDLTVVFKNNVRK